MKLYYGAAYYPELWCKDTINEDIDLMKDAGINVVRIGEFAWSSLEKHKDEFSIDIFSDVIELLYKNGIETIICTPTPTPPIWISNNHPERMIVDKDNVTMVHGGRQQVCTNNAYFRERVAVIVERMAKKYGKMKGVISWQIDNELKGNVSECYCETCKGLWAKWLQNYYKTIDNLNDAWCTHIWSQYYEDFSQVPQPFRTPAGHNPSLLSAYRIFSRDMVVSFITEQVDIIRKYSDYPITHNSSMNHYIDNQKSFQELDFASFDHYSECKDYYKYLSWVDTFKTLKDSPFWVMETSPSFSASTDGHQTAHNNGYIKAEALAAYASGAEGFSYWLWRQHRNGAEQTHGHVISSWGDKSIAFENVVKVSKAKDILEKAIADTAPKQASLAVTYSDRARVFFMAEPFESNGFTYTDEMMKLYKTILKTGIHRDFIFEDHDFSGYNLLFTPFLPYVSDDYFYRAKQFVIDGGTWIVGPITGIRTKDHGVNIDSALGKIEEFAGVKVKFNYPITGTDAIGNAFDVSAPLSLLSSVFQCDEAKAIGITQDGITPNMPFITECKRGNGNVVMLGSMPTGKNGEELIQKLILHFACDGTQKSDYDVSTGTITIPRYGKDINQYVVINMNGFGGRIKLNNKAYDAIAEINLEANEIEIAPYGFKVINFKK